MGGNWWKRKRSFSVKDTGRIRRHLISITAKNRHTYILIKTNKQKQKHTMTAFMKEKHIKEIFYDSARDSNMNMLEKSHHATLFQLSYFFCPFHEQCHPCRPPGSSSWNLSVKHIVFLLVKHYDDLPFFSQLLYMTEK